MSSKLILIFICLFLFVHCSSNTQIQPYEQTKILMDTFVQVVIFDQDKSSEDLAFIMDSTFNAIKSIDRRTNFYDEKSELSIINKLASQTSIEIDTTIYFLIKSANYFSEISNGAFDITTGGVKELWNFSENAPKIPDPEELQEQLKWVNYKLITLDGRNIKLASSKVKMDLGAIAKGYAVDEAIKILKSFHVRDALVNAGGDMRAICGKLTRGKRNIWIKNPGNRENLFGNFQFDDGAVATSGNYERFFFKDSVRYHHILDPKTGYPTRECISVTITAPTAMEADVLATTVFVLGPEKGLKLLNQLKNTDGLIIYDQDGTIKWIATNGLKEKFVLNENTD